MPEPIKSAIRKLVSHWYEYRGDATAAATPRGTVMFPSVPVPLTIQVLLGPYRVQYPGI